MSSRGLAALFYLLGWCASVVGAASSFLTKDYFLLGLNGALFLFLGFMGIVFIRDWRAGRLR